MVSATIFPSNNETKADCKLAIGLLYRRYLSADLFKADTFPRLMHCLEGSVRAGVEREPKPVTSLETLRNLQDAIQAATVCDDPNTKPKFLDMSDSLAEQGVDCWLASAYEDNRTQPAFRQISYGLKKPVILESDALIQNIHINTVVTGIIARGSQIQVNRKRRLRQRCGRVLRYADPSLVLHSNISIQPIDN
jgi:hypothetical protein